MADPNHFPAGVEAVASLHNPHELVMQAMQARLGFSRDDAAQMMSRPIKCPAPNAPVGSEATVGDFLTSEHGAAHTDAFFDNAEQAVQAGEGVEAAFQKGMTGMVMAAMFGPTNKETTRPTKSTEQELSAPDSKKK